MAINPIEQKHLKGLDYPASKDDIVEYAKSQGADKELCAALAEIPDGDSEKPTDVNKAIAEFS